MCCSFYPFLCNILCRWLIAFIYKYCCMRLLNIVPGFLLNISNMVKIFLSNVDFLTWFFHIAYDILYYSMIVLHLKLSIFYFFIKKYFITTKVHKMLWKALIGWKWSNFPYSIEQHIDEDVIIQIECVWPFI